MHRWKFWRCFQVAAAITVFGISALIWSASNQRREEGPDAPLPEVVVASPLSKADQAFLWDAESIGLELGQFAWPQLSQAIRDSDAGKIVAVCVDEFQAEVSTAPKEIEAAREFGRLVRRESSGDDWRNLDAREFAEWLLEHLEPFGETADKASINFSLKAISPVQRDQPENDWRGTVAIELRASAESGVRKELVILLDFQLLHPERDFYANGGWLRSCRVLQVSTASSDQPLMREVAEESGLPGDLHDNWLTDGNRVNTGGAHFCDYNRDGCLDALLIDTSKFAPLMLYRGTPEGRFVDATQEVGLANASHSLHAVFADLNNDGWEDLVLPGVAVFRNVGGKRFAELSHRSNLIPLIASHGPLVNITGVAVADYDRDGQIDLYVTRGDARNFKSGSWIDGKSGMQWQNQLLRNLGHGMFEDVTGRTGTSGDHRSVFTAAWLDANDDGRPDLYVIHEFGPGVLLLQGANEKFQEQELSGKSGDFGSMGLATGDINNDQQIDVFVSNMYSKAGNRVIDNLPDGHYDDEVMRKLRRMVSGSELYINNSQLAFEAVGKQMQITKIGWAWGPALVDLDNDGWLDIYSTCGFISHDRKKPDG